ncbi:hypothetical protein BP5796_13072 [Coleophoma crateriformis]|uniref:Rhodopsin domain-containing protein n=1 Tax=Coleophoma crateriformis TaxID=565419 RepID=A0A3D8Q4I8_9HELO|nr:hypothetical protein BP5796_13072 [Coleophoma crateriformis]
MEIPQPSEGDIDIGRPMMVIIWTLYGITIVVVAIRLYVQARITRRLGLGDAMMVLSVASGLGLCALLTVQRHYGLGRHFFFLDPHQRIMALKYNFIGQPFGIMGPSFGRMACVMLMLQLFGTTKWRRRGLWFLFWESLVVNTITIVLIYVQCEHVQSLWDPIGHPGRCWSPKVQEIVGFVQGGLNSAVDLVLTIMPATIFWKLQISTRLKVGLVILLGLSIFAFVACVIKTVLLQALGDRGDFTFNTVSFFIWVVVEGALVSIAASVPLIRPLFLRIKRGKSSKDNKSYEMHPYTHSSRYVAGASIKGAQLLRSIDEDGINNDSK